MSVDLDLKKVEDVLVQLQEDPSNYQISLSNWSLNLVKLLVSMKTNEYEIQRLKDDFRKCATNEERIKYLYGNVQLRDKLFELLDDMIDARKASDKDWEKAKKLRLEGKKKMDSKEYEEALWYQSRAVLSAPFPGSKKSETPENKLELANAFYERAEVLFRLKRYSDCLKDVEYANKLGLEFTSNARLLLLKIRCSKFLGELQTMEPEALKALIDALEELEADTKDPKLTEEIVEVIEDLKNPYGTRPEVSSAKRAMPSGVVYEGSNKHMPSVSKLVKLMNNEKQGRHLVATGTIPGNSTVMVETAYAAVLTLSAYKNHCNYCFKTLDGRIYPCSTCDKVLYCEEECERKAHEEYHKHDCQYIAVITDAEIFRLSLRILLKTGLDKAVAEYRKHEAGASKVATYSGDYGCILSLVEHSEHLPLLNSLSYSIVATFFALLIRDKMKLIPMKDEDLFYVVGGLLLKHIKQAVFNAVDVMVNDDTPFGLSVDGTKVGLGLYPTGALLNHSCDSNVTPLFDGTKMFMVTKRHVDTEEITYCYGPQVYHESRKMRHEELQNYLFKCECTRCVDPIEDYRDAVICPKCNGPLKYNAKDLSSKCLQCNEEDTGLDVAKVVADLKGIRVKMQYIMAYYQSRRLQKPEEAFEKVHEELKKFCYHQNQLLLNVKDLLTGFYLKTQNYAKAIELGESISIVEKDLFGETCIYYVYRLVKLTVWRWILAEKDQSMSEMDKLRTATQDVIDVAKKAVTKREEEGFTYISSNYISFQKELQLLKQKLEGN